VILSKKLIFSYELPFILSSLILLLPACSNSKLTSKELALLDHPPEQTQAKINALVPLAMKWYSKVEESLYPKGRSLTEAEKNQAIELGIRNPERIRVLILEKFPEPKNQITNKHFEGARTMGNIILIKPQHKNNSVILCHELVHIAQIDRMGLKQFLKRYALEREVLGYSRSLLENEAYAKQQVIK